MELLTNFVKKLDGERQEKWDRRFVDLARHVAQWSKDPSTKTGAVIVDPATNQVVSIGYNGFPIGVGDSPERYADRDTKYRMIVHCERNALLFARGSVRGYTLYTWPFTSCSVCAAMVIQAGITRVVSPTLPPHLFERWKEDTELAKVMFDEARVRVGLVEPTPQPESVSHENCRDCVGSPGVSGGSRNPWVVRVWKKAVRVLSED